MVLWNRVMKIITKMGLDSVELIMDVEKHFSISIPDRDAEKAHTVGKLVDCVAGILGVNKYNFAFREKTFDNIKKALLELDNSIADFPIISVVSRSLNTADKPLLRQLEEKTGLKFPGIDTNAYEGNSIFLKLGKWFKSIETIEFTEITWKKYIDILLAVNLEKLHPPILYYSKYEIYIAIMRITVDKIGVMYEEIGIEKSFTDDLGID